MDPPLSPLGEAQAELVAARLAAREDGAPLPIPGGAPFGIWHSPLSRAAQTAQAIARAQPVEVAMHPTELMTEIAQGEWEGLPHSEVSSRWSAELAAWRASPVQSHAPGGESLGEAALRVAAALNEIMAALADGRDGDGPSRPPLVPGYSATSSSPDDPDPWAILVAHDGIFRLTLMTLLNIPIERFWSFPFNLCSLTVVSLHGGAAALRAHNLGDHLAPLAASTRASAEATGDRRGAL